MYTLDNVNNFKMIDENDYFLKRYNEWKVNQDQKTLDELFYIACHVYPVLARNLPANRLEKYDIIHVVNEVQKGRVTGAASDGIRMTATGSPVQLEDEKRCYSIHIKNDDTHYYIRAYDSDKETVLKWIMKTNNVKYYRNYLTDEYDMYTGLIRGQLIPLFKVKLFERQNKIYVVYEINEGLKKYIKIRQALDYNQLSVFLYVIRPIKWPSWFKVFQRGTELFSLVILIPVKRFLSRVL